MNLLLRGKTASTDWADYRDFCLQACVEISQSGTPVALFGSAVPVHFESLKRRACFSTLYYLALTCNPDVMPGFNR